MANFILDLVQYTPERNLAGLRFLEPSFGRGSFLVPAVSRLLDSWGRSGRPNPTVHLRDAIRAVEVHRSTYDSTREDLAMVLAASGMSSRQRNSLLDAWLVCGDFLLVDLPGQFDFVVGNPPYVRQELIDDVLIECYRSKYRTIFDRADIYIPFFERGLSALGPSGELGFICADRWMKNKYGGPLRSFVAAEYHLKVYVDMVDTPAFDSDVVAYPAVTIFSRRKHGADATTLIARRPAIDANVLTTLAKDLLGKTASSVSSVCSTRSVVCGEQPWLLESSDELDLLRRLETNFPTLEEAGCKVGIGVATGADKAFIGRFEDLDVEADRKLPLVMTGDLAGESVEWQGFGVVNPFDDDGKLVNLEEYPRLHRYMQLRRDVLLKRHVAKKSPASWYRTIDRITPALARKPKLLIPDIKGKATVVYEQGRLYPHHNLYYIVSDTWDLAALRVVLCSGIARLFVAKYSTSMRGGYLRFQAQYLRRIRLPAWSSVSPALRKKLSTAGNPYEAKAAVFELYSLNDQEIAALQGDY